MTSCVFMVGAGFWLFLLFWRPARRYRYVYGTKVQYSQGVAKIVPLDQSIRVLPHHLVQSQSYARYL